MNIEYIHKFSIFCLYTTWSLTKLNIFLFDIHTMMYNDVCCIEQTI